MTDTDLRAAVAHIKLQASYRKFHFTDIGSSDMDECIATATILNAVASGDLVPRADVGGLVEALVPFKLKASEDYANEITSNGSQRIANICGPFDPKYHSHLEVQIDLAFKDGWNAALAAWENLK